MKKTEIKRKQLANVTIKAIGKIIELKGDSSTKLHLIVNVINKAGKAHEVLISELLEII